MLLEHTGMGVCQKLEVKNVNTQELTAGLVTFTRWRAQQLMNGASQATLDAEIFSNPTALAERSGVSIEVIEWAGKVESHPDADKLLTAIEEPVTAEATGS